MNHDAWPALPYEAWMPTKKTLHMCAQMIGKARLALSPPQPEWLHACLYLDGRGFTTAAMPHGTDIVSMGIDVYESAIWIRVSDGRVATVPLGSPTAASPTSGRVSGMLSQAWASTSTFGRSPRRSPTPRHSQRTDTTARLSPRTRSVFAGFSPRSTQSSRNFARGSSAAAACSSGGAASTSRCCFSPGKHEKAPDDRGYIMRYDLDAEHMNAGFWPGDDNNPHPAFYAYLVPRPEGCETAPVGSEHAGWVEAMGEWVMPYEAVRTSGDPRRTILAFLDSVYGVATTLGGWDAESAHLQETFAHPWRPRRIASMTEG